MCLCFLTKTKKEKYKRIQQAFNNFKDEFDVIQVVHKLRMVDLLVDYLIGKNTKNLVQFRKKY